MESAKKILKNILKLFFVIILIFGVQLAVFILFYHPYIIKWGASDYEINMLMPGDKYAGYISSTRAIDIHKPAKKVWTYLVDLGADRKGFYSYTFLENLLGLQMTNKADNNHEMNVGRLVPVESPDSNGKYDQGFYVIEVEQGHSFVLQGWGDFLINETDDNNSRLIVRTQYKTPNNMIERLENSIFDMLHYIMERRMMLGIKDNAESNGRHYNYISDWVWFLSVFISGLAGLVMIFICKGYFKVLVPTVFFTIWQLTISVLNPRPLTGIIIILLTAVFIFLCQFFIKNKKQYI